MMINRLINPITRWLNKEKPPRQVPLSNFERIRYELKTGDVILVEGRSRVSDVIRMITQSPWTHAALYIGRLHDIEDPKFRDRVAHYFSGDPEQQLIIESMLGEGVVIKPLSKYTQDHLRICRPRGLNYKDSQQAINFSISRLGLDYDVRQILDLARFLFPWFIMPRRWRSSLFSHNTGKPTRTVCSTMIAEAFGYIQFPILPLVEQSTEQGTKLYWRNPKLCTPRDFDYSPYFDIIKYPFIDTSDYGTYRLLPWHDRSTSAEADYSFGQIPGQTDAQSQEVESDELRDMQVMKPRQGEDVLVAEIKSGQQEAENEPDLEDKKQA